MKPEVLPIFPTDNETTLSNGDNNNAAENLDPYFPFQHYHWKSPFPLLIYLYWPFSELDFTIHSFKTLESLLGNYPNAYFIIKLLPTKEVRVYDRFPDFHEIKDLIHPFMFQKYKKLFYHLELEFFHEKELNCLLEERDANEIDDILNGNGRSNPFLQTSKDYLAKYIQKCCENCHILCFENKAYQENENRDHSNDLSFQQVPYHLISYLHFLLLYRTGGGIYTDFSFYFTNPLEKALVHQVNTIFVLFYVFFSNFSLNFLSFLDFPIYRVIIFAVTAATSTLTPRNYVFSTPNYTIIGKNYNVLLPRFIISNHREI
jgi:hypothetical protein